MPSATIALEAEKRGSPPPPRLRKKTQRVASAAQQKSGALSFSGLGRAETPFSFAQTSDFENLGNIREKENLRG